MSKVPVNLCLHDIKDEGQQQHQGSASPLKVAFLSFPLSPNSEEPPVSPPYVTYYQFKDHSPITVENYSVATFMTDYQVPIAEWTHEIGTNYVAWVEELEGETTPVYCPPLICRSDNIVIIIIDDEMDVYNYLKETTHSTQFFTNVCPNERGCVTLPIVLPETEDPYDPEYANFYAFVYYYGQTINGQRTIVRQKFPIYDLNEIPDLRTIPNSANGKQFRIGFKTYYETESSVFLTDVLPVVWVDFGSDIFQE